MLLVSSHIFLAHTVVYIAIPECLVITSLVLLDELHGLQTTVTQLAKLSQPRTEFLHQQGILAVCLHLSRCILHLFKFLLQSIKLSICKVVDAEALGFP